MDDCLQGKLGDPGELHESTDTELRAEEERHANLRVRSLEIQNFRAYRKNQVFDLSADITILYGPNGFGKTSFFDAIDFVSTGDIGRLECSAGAKFVKAAKHLDSDGEKSFVRLSFTEDGDASTIMRSVDDAANAFLDGKMVNRKAALAKLTQSTLSQSDSIQNFLRLFRATHLFSQEHQELLADFQKHCQFDEAVVSRLLSLEDYAGSVAKTEEICDHLRRTIRQEDEARALLTSRISEAQKQLASLTASTTVPSGAILDAEIATLQVAIRETGISVDNGILSVPTLRSWRTQMEMKQGEATSRMNSLSSLIDSARSLGPLQAATHDLTSRLKEVRKELEDLENRVAVVESLLRASEGDLAEARSGEALNTAALGALKWVIAAKPQYVELRRREKSLDAQVVLLSKTNDALRISCKESRDLILKSGDKIATVAANRSVMREMIERLGTLRARIAAWRVNAIQLDVLRTNLNAAKVAGDAARVAEETAKKEMDVLRRSQENLRKTIEQVDRNQTDLRRLVSQLQVHVADGLCPLCGVDHGSRARLLADIESFTERDNATSSREQLSLLRTQEVALKTVLSKSVEERESAAEEIGRLQKLQNQVIHENVAIVRALNEAGVDADFTGKAPESSLESRLDEAEKNANASGQKLDTIKSELERLRQVLAEQEFAATDAQGKYSKAAFDLKSVREAIALLVEDPRCAEAKLESEEAVVSGLVIAAEQKAQSLAAMKSSVETLISQYKAEQTTKRQRMRILREQVSAVHRQQATNEKEIGLITARFEQAGVPVSMPAEMLAELVAAEAGRLTKMTALKEATANMEMAVDAATTAAAYTRVVQDLRKDETARETLNGTRERNWKWFRYFEKISEFLMSRQDSSVEKMIREYGPRASTIQQRLRPVYGFDAIELHAKESSIDVRVMRVKEELRPTDYFSQSQQQTLVLGLFLTACLSQTWSGMSAIFLDDPVTHFDDLNTYSFLDLILGLRESGFDRRQFVISTCDEKVLQLARHKFRHLGDKARFYKFTAIGPQGPLVEVAP